MQREMRQFARIALAAIGQASDLARTETVRKIRKANISPSVEYD